ncbi:hypothetical protein MHYP_G00277590 [Metynnis hypsauchen]
MSRAALIAHFTLSRPIAERRGRGFHSSNQNRGEGEGGGGGGGGGAEQRSVRGRRTERLSRLQLVRTPAVRTASCSAQDLYGLDSSRLN